MLASGYILLLFIYTIPFCFADGICCDCSSFNAVVIGAVVITFIVVLILVVLFVLHRRGTIGRS